MEKFIEFVKALIQRPAMYGISRVEDFDLVFLGYITAEKEHNIEISNFLIGFRKYVNYQFDLNQEAEWYRIIRFYSSSESNSITLFARYFNEYCEKI